MKRPLAAYLSVKIWARSGDGRRCKVVAGVAQWNGMGRRRAGGDAARFWTDRIAQADGVIEGKRLVPRGWFDEAGSPKAVGVKMVDYGYLRWPVPKGGSLNAGAFEARGIFGQHLYIDRREKLVIVVLSARPKPTESTVVDDAAFFGVVVKALECA
jgi:CubicO group peptidase (beta-lactamase class C family)